MLKDVTTIGILGAITRIAAARAACAGHAAVNRTREIGVTRAVAQTYHHLLELLDQASTKG